MKLTETSKVDKEEVEKIDFDLFVCSSGYEQRACFIAQTVKINARHKVVFCFKNHLTEKFRLLNDKFYSFNKFTFIYEEGNQTINITKILNELMLTSGTTVNIAVDYSSMTSVWYSAIVSYFNVLNSNKQVNLYFFYCFAEFSAPNYFNVRNTNIGPMKDFSSLSIPDKPTAIIIGLGYEDEKAFGLTEYFDAETYLFIADQSVSVNYYNEVLRANKSLIDNTKAENIFEYSLLYLDHSESLLYSVCKSLKSDYRLVLAPTGPKPFMLLCLLTASRLMEIDVWRISVGVYGGPSNKKPNGCWSCYSALFSAFAR